ncbi:lysylphosphatidylglycerol synthase transmembrane domain-containing protein [Actinocorallia sp. A-T 12471]|uniref:lysylphosphatidylglycerol synthase transmembrane domain-containing protein n=1 Tax=Actinocorallia sp. A-T 12471 TaxID=3089813 RepID=UPI0029CF5A86|nr:lysylphosphatidylglycerol synthase domain-containing protein [Actinocorallia sp. A-T 12471]MDX6739321.1 lysylphosphatidylglycerol synthase domain-containing protein [Actinocorallia sp. A-T 12471]
MEAVGAALAAMHWGVVPVLAVLAVLHYVFEATALRSAAGRPLRLGRTTLTQFTAAAAARITPGGLGGIAVNARYLTVCGIPLPTAATAVTAYTAGLVLGRVVVVLLVIALTGDLKALDGVADRVGGFVAGLADPGMALVAAGVGLAVTALVWTGVRRARRGGGRSPREALAESWEALRDLARRPRDLAGVLASSVGVAVVLGVAFALSVLAVPGTETDPAQLGVLVGAYFVGSAVGSAVPVPGGVGTSEAAFTGTLILLGIAALPALQAVLVFRLITYWAPVPVGIAASRVALARP